MTSEPTADVTIGSRIRRYREQKGFSLSHLARESEVSKGYLWSLENDTRDQDRRPSGKTLYAIAKVLGVTMSDLLGEKLILQHDTTVDPALRRFADEEGLSQADVEMLASIQWRGERPKTTERWRWIYNAIVMSEQLDDT